jgi:hypothetical protein
MENHINIELVTQGDTAKEARQKICDKGTQQGKTPEPVVLDHSIVK